MLAHLTRDELLAVVEAHDLVVDDRRVKDRLVEAVDSAKASTLAVVLGGTRRLAQGAARGAPSG